MLPIQTIAILLFALATSAHAESSSHPIQLITFKTHSRLILAVDVGVDAQWKETQTGFELFLKGVSLTDLGAPLGQEQAWLAKQGNLSDTRVSQIEMKESTAGLSISGKWKFEQGPNSPAEHKMERFEYREPSPSKFIVDFWQKAGLSVVELARTKKNQEHAANLLRTEEQSKRRQARRIASIKAKADTQDVGKFCRQPLSEEQDIFLPFSPLHEKVSFERWFSSTTPDDGYPYNEPKASITSEDAQYVRLALNLYRKGKFALTLKALEFFDKEQPKSAFKNDMHFLRANAMIKLGYKDAALSYLEELKSTTVGSPAALQAGIFIANQKWNSGAYLLSLENNMWLSSQYSGHALNWVFRLAVAESLYSLKQADRAVKEYQWVVDNAPDRTAKAEGAMRLGDVYLSRFQYDRALAAYYQAIDGFKGESKKFPATYINRAESLYWLGQYDRAEQAFTEFLKDFPGNPAGWRATLRLGEIYGRQSGDKADGESRKWFYNTINSYPFSPGATIARARLVPCGDHGGFDAESSEKFFSTEAETFATTSKSSSNVFGEVITDRYNDLRALARVRSLISFHENGEAIDAAIEELEHTKSGSNEQIAQILRNLFRNTILSLLSEGKKFEAINLYDKKWALVPKERKASDAVEPDYILKLSQAASDLGLGEMAQNLAESFKKSSVRFESARAIASGTTADHGSEDLDLKLEKSEQSFTVAKALWMASGSKENEKIRANLDQVIEESPFTYEREIILGLLDEKANKPASALAHAAKAQLLSPSGNLSEQMRMEYWVATLQSRAGNSRSAVDIFRKLQTEKLPAEGSGEIAANLGVSAVGNKESLVLMEGEILARTGKWGEAAAAYGHAVNEGLGGNQALYEYARALKKSGDTESNEEIAQATMQKLADSKIDDFWRKLARKTLAGTAGN